MLARLRSIDPRLADVLLGAAFLIEGLLELALLVPDGSPDRGRATVLIVAVGVTVALRRRLVAWLMAAPLFHLFNVLPEAAYSDHLVSPFFALILVLYSSGRHAATRVLVPVTALNIALLWASQSVDRYEDSFAGYLFTAGVLVLGPVLLGRVMRNRSRLNRTLEEKAGRLDRERREGAAAAAGEERARIAGELHDVVAHALSAMVVQASAARRLAAAGTPAAGEAFAAVETSGREALVEIRSLLGVLRREDEELALAPQPSLRHLRSLVERVRAAGLETELVVEGEQRDLAIGIDLTAYRVVQEALGGALEHGGAAHADVRVEYAAHHVLLEIDDDGSAQARPLLGIRERVVLSGGHLQAGARRRGGHRVRAQLPLGAAT